MPPYWFIVQLETGHDFATSLDLKISEFTRPHIVRFVIRRMRVDGSCIRKEKGAASKISGHVWTVPSGGVQGYAPLANVLDFLSLKSPFGVFLPISLKWWKLVWIHAC